MNKVMVSNFDKAYSVLKQYVKLSRANTISANTLRDKVFSNTKGLRAPQFGALIQRAIREGLIVSVGQIKSTEQHHNRKLVGVYKRGA